MLTGIEVYFLRIERELVLLDPVKRCGYLVGLRVAEAVCRSHIASAERKFGPRSQGARIGRADLCCIIREIRRITRLEQITEELQHA